ncbi:MAG: hypothetical protein B6242_15670 [Anaerolineaceae bacterium 4572_78]|nr:MAG: hypothetical protein B6242_15670 [Anaerolineaceae bacterium 4572_78]
MALNNFEIGFAGETITYNHTITNVGSVTDSFQIEITRKLGFTTTQSINQTPNLIPGQNMHLTVLVTIPVTATADMSEETTVTMISQGDPNQKDIVVNITQVISFGDKDNPIDK